MKKFLYVGSCLPFDDKSSSSKFEVSIIRQFYNKYGNNASFVSVPNGFISNEITASDFKIDNQIEVIPMNVNKGNFNRIAKQTHLLLKYMINWCKVNKESEKVIFIINSMLNISIPTLLMKLLFNCKIVSFTIDTPIAYLNTKSGINYYISKGYYNLSLNILKKFDGIVLLNKKAYKLLKLRIPYHISKIGFNPEDYKDIEDIGNKSSKRIITYSGTLVEYNGINQLLSSFEYINDNNIVLNIYGDGPLKDTVIKAATQKENIFYCGLIDNKEMMNSLRSSDIVINPRITMDEVNNYTFPSKLIEYLLSGAAVLTTRINSIPREYDDFVYYIEDESPKGIASAVIKLLNIPKSNKKEKAILSKKYLYENQTWEKVIYNVDSFLNTLT